MTKEQMDALSAWMISYSARLDRINNGSGEDYGGTEQDLFEAFNCETNLRNSKLVVFAATKNDILKMMIALKSTYSSFKDFHTFESNSQFSFEVSDSNEMCVHGLSFLKAYCPKEFVSGYVNKQ